MDDLIETKLASAQTLRDTRELQMRVQLQDMARMRKPTAATRKYLALLCTEWLSANSECSELQRKLENNEQERGAA